MKMTAGKLALVLGSGILFSSAVRSADWPHWLGPNGDNIAPTDAFVSDLGRWEVAWRANVGRGYSSIAVAGKFAYTLGHDEKAEETVYCFNAGTGEVVWKHTYVAQLMPTMHPGGPNATPTVTGDRVLTISKDGKVFCFSADQGRVLWQTNLVTAAGVPLPKWGFASSPVVSGNQVIFAAGKVTALDMGTGRVRWTSSESYQPGYTTAVVFEQAGKQYVAALDGKGLSILNAADGVELARRPFKAMFDMTGTTPFVLTGGKRLFISGNTSSELLEFDGKTLSLLWSGTDIKNAMNNSVIVDGVIYGIDGRQGTPTSRFVAVNVDDGKLNWAQSDFGYGTTIGVGKSAILALTENGELVALKPTSTGYTEISRQSVLGKTCWTTPVYAGNRIYVRNDRGDVVCLSAS